MSHQIDYETDVFLVVLSYFKGIVELQDIVVSRVIRIISGQMAECFQLRGCVVVIGV